MMTSHSRPTTVLVGRRCWYMSSGIMTLAVHSCHLLRLCQGTLLQWPPLGSVHIWKQQSSLHSCCYSSKMCHNVTAHSCPASQATCS